MTKVKIIHQQVRQKWQSLKQRFNLMLGLAKFYLLTKKMQRKSQKRAAIEQLIQDKEQVLNEQQVEPSLVSHASQSEAAQTASLEHLVTDLFQALGGDKMGSRLDSLLSQGLDFTNHCEEELSATLDRLVSQHLAPYLTRAELEPFSMDLDELSKELQSMQNQLNQLTRCHEIN